MAVLGAGAGTGAGAGAEADTAATGLQGGLLHTAQSRLMVVLCLETHLRGLLPVFFFAQRAASYPRAHYQQTRLASRRIARLDIRRREDTRGLSSLQEVDGTGTGTAEADLSGIM